MNVIRMLLELPDVELNFNNVFERGDPPLLFTTVDTIDPPLIGKLRSQSFITSILSSFNIISCSSRKTKRISFDTLECTYH